MLITDAVNSCDERARVGSLISALETAVMDWIGSHRAWDERQHAAIMQSLGDVREYSLTPCAPNSPSISSIIFTLGRLDRRIGHPAVQGRIRDLGLALQGGFTAEASAA